MPALTELQQAKARVVQLTEVLHQYALSQHMAYHRAPYWDRPSVLFDQCDHEMCKAVRAILANGTYEAAPQGAGTPQPDDTIAALVMEDAAGQRDFIRFKSMAAAKAQARVIRQDGTQCWPVWLRGSGHER